MADEVFPGGGRGRRRRGGTAFIEATEASAAGASAAIENLNSGVNRFQRISVKTFMGSAGKGTIKFFKGMTGFLPNFVKGIREARKDTKGIGDEFRRANSELGRFTRFTNEVGKGLEGLKGFAMGAFGSQGMGQILETGKSTTELLYDMNRVLQLDKKGLKGLEKEIYGNTRALSGLGVTTKEMATTYDLLIKERITDTNLLRVLSRETMRFAKVSGAAPEQVTGAFGAIFDKLKLNIDTLPNFQSAILKAMNVSGASA